MKASRLMDLLMDQCTPDSVVKIITEDGMEWEILSVYGPATTKEADPGTLWIDIQPKDAK